MSTRTVHGTDCFEVEAFLQRSEASKLFKVRDKRGGGFYCMEVATRNDHKGSANTFVQETRHSNSQFLMNLRFTFQTYSKLYYILQFVSQNTLAAAWGKEGPFSETRVRFYACDILTGLEELHDNGLKYGELSLDKVLVDSAGHAVLWRTFCGKKYWLRQECVCDLSGFRLGYPCENSHVPNTERELRTDLQDLGFILLQLFSRDSLTGVINRASTPDERYSLLATQSLYLPTTLSSFARDLVTRLLKGQFYSTDQVKNHPFFHGVKWHEVKARKATQHQGVSTSANSQADVRPMVHATTPYGYERQSNTPHTTSASRQGYPPYGTSYRLQNASSSPDISMYGSKERWPPPSRPTLTSPRPRSYPDYPPPADWSYSPQTRERGMSNSMTDLRDLDDQDPYPLYSRGRTVSMTELNNVDQLNNNRGEYIYRNDAQYYTAENGMSSDRYRARSGGRNTPTNFSDYSPRNSFTPTNFSDYSPRENFTPTTFSDYSPRDNREYHRGYNRQPYSGETSSMDAGRPLRKSLENRSISYSTKQEFEQLTGNQRHSLERPPPISRARSCSELDRVEADETGDSDDRLSTSYDARHRRFNNDRVSIGSSGRSRQPMRNDHLLARIPIPSFAEFKRRKSGGEETLLRSNKDTDVTGIENSKRIQSAEERWNREKKMAASSMNGYEPRRMDDSTNSPSERQGRNYFSKNEVIHNLMLKYNLYDSDDTRENGRRRRRNGVMNNEVRMRERNHGMPGRREDSTNAAETITPTRAEEVSSMEGKQGEGKDIERHREGHSKHDRRRSPRITRKSYSTLTSQTSTELISNGIIDSKADANGQIERPKVTRKSYSLLSAQPSAEEIHSKSDKHHRRKSPNISRKSQSTLSSESFAQSISEEVKSHHRETGDANNNTSPSAQINTSSKSGRNDNRTTNLAVSTQSSPRAPVTINDAQIFNRDTIVNTGSPLPRRGSNLSVSDLYKPAKPVQRSPSGSSISSSTSKQGAEDLTLDVNTETKASGLHVASKTLWGAAKFKLRLGKSPSNSPKSQRKSKEEKKAAKNGTIEYEVESGETSPDSKQLRRPEPEKRLSKEDLSPRSRLTVDDSSRLRRVSAESFSPQGQLRKTGVHTSLLSISSSIYSTDTDLDDSVSWQSDGDPVDTGTPRNKKRWDSFHSTISADSGSAHMFDFETDSMATEFDDAPVFVAKREADAGDHRPDADIERADSGVGGDLGPDPRTKTATSPQSWEDIVHKSSKHWCVVAASAKHWQEIARKKKLEKEHQGKLRKNVAPVITENMVECPDCLKHYVPADETRDRIEEDGTATSIICPKCLERRVERKEAIIELVQTEINYGNDLQILKEEFYSPMQSGSILTPDNLAAIFLNLQELVEVNTKFSSRLQSSLEESVAKGDEEFCQVNVGSVFLESVEFFQSYEIYCSKQSSASLLLESLQKKNELLKIFLNVTCRENPKCRKMDLNSFLLAPVQRIMKYPLLLSRIRKTTPRGNSDREKLMMAQRRIEDQLNRINSLNSAVESKQRRYRGSGHLGRSDSLDKLQMKKMASEILSWTLGEMQLLMHGVFEVTIQEFASSASWNKRSARKTVDVFMLFCIRGHVENITVDSDDEGQFDDPLFPSETDATDAALVMLKKKINGKYTLFREPLFLDNCVVIRDSERKDSFEILKMGTETYLFKALTSRENRRWLKYLRIQAKDLGAWRRRRNGLPNIMIKTI